MKVREGNVEVNGINIHYWEVGHGPPLILLHGLGLDLTYWRPQMEFFAPGYRVIACDLRGHGKSGGQELRFEFMDWVYDLYAFLNALGIEKPYLCGHSLGADVALQFAITYPNDVAALVAADAPTPGNQLKNRLGFKVRQVVVALSRVLWPWSPLAPLARPTQKKFYSPRFQRAYRDAMAAFRRGFKSLSVSGLMRSTAALLRRPESGRDLARIQAPTLLLRGTGDRVVSMWEAFRYRHRIKGAQLHHIRDSGHMTLQEQPLEFNDLTDLFFLGRLHEQGAWPIRRSALDLGRLVLATLLGALVFALGTYLFGGNPLAYGAVLAQGALPTVQAVVGGLSVVAACLFYALAWALLFAVPEMGKITRWLVFGLAASFVSIIIMPGSAPVGFASGWPHLAVFLAMALIFAAFYRPAVTDD